MKRIGNENSEAAEKDERKRFAFRRTENEAFCMICERQVKLLTFEQAAEILKTNFREILEFIETGFVHCLHTSRGKVAVCADSVFDVLENRPTQPFNPDIFKTNPSNLNSVF